MAASRPHARNEYGAWNARLKAFSPLFLPNLDTRSQGSSLSSVWLQLSQLR